MSSRSNSAINFSRAGNAMYNAAGFKIGKPNAFEIGRDAHLQHYINERTGLCCNPREAPPVECRVVYDISGIYFCDGAYVGHGGSFDITSIENMNIKSSSYIIIDPTNTVGIKGILDMCGNNIIFGNDNVKVGDNAGFNTQKVGAIAVGTNAGENNQGSYSVAVGYAAGQITQQAYAVAVGPGAGQNSQQFASVAIGGNAGQNNQQQTKYTRFIFSCDWNKFWVSKSKSKCSRIRL